MPTLRLMVRCTVIIDYVIYLAVIKDPEEYVYDCGALVQFEDPNSYATVPDHGPNDIYSVATLECQAALAQSTLNIVFTKFTKQYQMMDL